MATAYDILIKELGPENLPDEVIIIGIEVERYDSFSEELSETVSKAVPKAVAMAEEELSKILSKK
ncbi:MAG: hypothetical protein FK732_10690 [Asgard group archaeon]|nr:hypothetical protein [Asgard group archaeon]